MFQIDFLCLLMTGANKPGKDKNDIRTDELFKEHSQFEETVDSTANKKKQYRNSQAEDTKNKEQCHVCLRTVNKSTICVNCKQKCHRKGTEPDALCLFEPWICKKMPSYTPVKILLPSRLWERNFN